MSQPEEPNSVLKFFGLSEFEFFTSYVLSDVLNTFHAKIQHPTEENLAAIEKIESLFVRKVSHIAHDLQNHFLSFELVRDGSFTADEAQPVLYATLFRILDDERPLRIQSSRRLHVTATNEEVEENAIESLLDPTSQVKPPLQITKPTIFMLNLAAGRQFGLQSIIRFRNHRPMVRNPIRSFSFFPEGTSGNDQNRLKRWSFFEVTLMAQIISQQIPATSMYNLHKSRFSGVMYDALVQGQDGARSSAAERNARFSSSPHDFTFLERPISDKRAVAKCQAKFDNFKAQFEHLKATNYQIDPIALEDESLEISDVA